MRAGRTGGDFIKLRGRRMPLQHRVVAQEAAGGRNKQLEMLKAIRA